MLCSGVKTANEINQTRRTHRIRRLTQLSTWNEGLMAQVDGKVPFGPRLPHTCMAIPILGW